MVEGINSYICFKNGMWELNKIEDRSGAGVAYGYEKKCFSYSIWMVTKTQTK